MTRPPPPPFNQSPYATPAPSAPSAMPPPPRRHNPQHQAQTIMECSTARADIVGYIRTIVPRTPAEQNFVDMMWKVATEIKDELKAVYWARSWRQEDDFGAEIKVLRQHIRIFEEAAKRFRDAGEMRVGLMEAGWWVDGLRVLSQELRDLVGY